MFLANASLEGVQVQNLALAALTSQTQGAAVQDEDCIHPADAAPPPPAMSGILGVGPTVLEAGNTTDWMTLLFAQTPSLAPYFSVQQCAAGGRLAIGELPSADTVFLQATSAYYYAVPLTGVWLRGGPRVAVDPAAYTAVVDTGTNTNLFTREVYDAVMGTLRLSFGTSFPWSSSRPTWIVQATATDLNAFFPPLLLLLGDSVLSLPAVGGYLGIVGGNSTHNLVRLALDVSPVEGILLLGWPALSAFSVTFNVTGTSVGFAPLDPAACNASTFGGGGGGGRLGSVASLTSGGDGTDVTLIVSLVVGLGLIVLFAALAGCTLRSRSKRWQDRRSRRDKM